MKKFLVFLLAALLLHGCLPITPAPTPAPTQAPELLGDVDGDGEIGLIDLLKAQKHILGAELLTGDSHDRADTNGDGVVDETDRDWIQGYLLQEDK